MEMIGNPKERGEYADKIVSNPEISSEELNKWYDKWAETYEEDIVYFSNWDKHLDEFVDFVRVNEGSRILDIAAGTGLVGQNLKERGYNNIDALDGSKGMLQKAKEKGIYKNYIHVWLGSQSIKRVDKDTYDALICLGAHSINHVNYKCYENLVALTKPGGYIYLLGTVAWLMDQRQEFENKMKKMQEEGIWKMVLMKESPISYYRDDQTLIYAFKVMK